MNSDNMYLHEEEQEHTADVIDHGGGSGDSVPDHDEMDNTAKKMDSLSKKWINTSVKALT
jgi:hypothetical protein